MINETKPYDDFVRDTARASDKQAAHEHAIKHKHVWQLVALKHQQTATRMKQK